MRLTLLIASLAAGGAERVLSTLATYWSHNGYEVTLITLASEATDFYTLGAQVERVALDVSRLSPSPLSAIVNNLRRIRLLREAIRNSRPDCVLSFIDRTNVLTMLACRGAEYPVVVSERVDPRYYSIGPVWEYLRRKTYPHAAYVVVQTNGAAEWARRVAGSANVEIIPNPVWVEPMLTSSEPGRDRKHVVMAAGRLEAQKGFDLLLKAFRQCHDELSEWSLVIYGEGPQRRSLEQLRDRLLLKDCVELPGVSSNIGLAYKEASLFVLSSRFEGFPNVLLEAMASGVAVVSFDCPSGPADIVTNGVDGLLVPVADSGELARAMLALMSSPVYRLKLAEAALVVHERYSINRIAPMWENVLSRAASIGTTCKSGAQSDD